MTLNRQSNILAWLAIIAVIVVIIAARFSIIEVRGKTEQITMAENIVKGISHFRFLIMETTLYNEQRSAEQWQAHAESFRKMIATQNYSSAKENALLTKEKNNLKVLVNLYGRLKDIDTSANTPLYSTETQERTVRTISALFLTTQDMLDDAFELVNLNRIDLAEAQNQSALFMQLSIGLLTILIAAGCIIIKRRVLIPVAALRLGTEKVTNGDLGFRLNLPTHNEIGMLGNTFDRMTEELENAQNATQQTVQMLANKTIELTNTQHQLQTIIDHIPALVGSWDVNLCNRFGNRAYVEWFDITPEKMHGKHMRDIINNERFQQIEPHLKLVLQGDSVVFERTIQYPNGDIRYAVFSYVPDIENGIVNGLYGFVNDVTPLKQAQLAKEKVLVQLQDIVDAAKDFAIIETDEYGVITLFSRGAEILLGYQSEEIIGKKNAILFHLHEEVITRGEILSIELGRPLSGFDAIVEMARQGESDSREWTYVHKDSTTLSVNLIVTAIRNSSGVITGYLGIAKDIREDKKNLQLLQETRDIAQAASFAKSQFLANMSHEIRTPLNAVLGITQLLERTPLSLQQKKYLKMITSSGKSLLDILNDILDFSKIEAGRMEMAQDTFRLDELLHSLATIMSVSAGEKNLELAIGVELDVPPVMIGDALRLQQVLVNLISNAVKFTEQGEVSMLVKCIAQQPDTVTLCFIVRDTGIGMTQAQQNRLFSPFTQADVSTTRKFGGTGLGLTISRRLVALMEGTIEMRSVLEQGSEFSVSIPMTLPLKKTDNETNTNINKNENKNKNENESDVAVASNLLGPLRLLVVDDNQTSRDYLNKAIQSWHWDAEQVASGKQAVQRILELNEKGESYDAVLINWQMPELNGLETMQAIRELQPESAMPMIMMVNAFGRNQLMEAEAAMPSTMHPDAYLFKPITSSSLFESLHEALTRGGSDLIAPIEISVLETRTRLNAHLLLVEDNAFNQMVARGLLEHAGATVDIVENGKKAIDLLRTNVHAYDLILMDVQMPVMDGFTATRLIRNELALTLPVLAMTAGVTEFEREQCIASGMNDLIAKPIDVEEMLATINRYLPEHVDLKPVENSIKHIANTQPEVADVNKSEQARDIFNVDQLLSMGETDAAYATKIIGFIRDIVDSSNRSMDDVTQAWGEGRRKDMARMLHSIRGSIGMLGAKRFIGVAHALEIALPDNDTQQIEILLKQMQQELTIMLSAAREWLAIQPTLLTDSTIPTISLEQLDHFKNLLKQHNLEACDIYIAMRSALDSRLSAEDILGLRRAMTYLDFKRALTFVELIAQNMQ